MDLTPEQQLNRLLDAYSHAYDVERDVTVEDTVYPAMATYFLRDENYLISRKHVLSAMEQHEYVYEVALEHPLEADCQAHERDRQNKHHAAHRRGAALDLMPFDLSFYLLPGFLGAQPRNIILSECRRKQERQHERSDQLYRHNILQTTRGARRPVFLSSRLLI